MYYIIGDIHGCVDNLDNLYDNIKKEIKDDDTLIFLGDYIDRGPSSFDVIEQLIYISENYNTIFLKGNHEDMFLKFKSGNYDFQNYIDNGGMTTLRSYKENRGNSSLPHKHQLFFENLIHYYETEDFIAVHAGLNPKINTINDQSEYDMIWIRDNFYRKEKKWGKTIIFGHTPCNILHGKMNSIFYNDKNNIIGIDTGACYGGLLTCLRWPDKIIFQG